ncbi:MAG TPA: hypothetical protein VKU36_04535 [Candidatus Babeliales bacterium]|nr:hypothetical protein [Candidatus Babeliales bacterium]
MKYISLLSIAFCIYANSSCMEITLSDGTNKFKRLVKETAINREKINLTSVTVHNKTPWPIEAQIEGFGVKDINSELQDWKFYTGGVNIMSEQNYLFTIPTYSTQLPVSSTLYRLYAHALIVKYPNQKNSEVHFPNPLNAQSNCFIVKNDETTEDFRLIIENTNK